MKAIAAKTIVSLREKPSSGMSLDDELLYGMVVEVLKEVPDEDGDGEPWLLVRTAYRYEGYCRKGDLLCVLSACVYVLLCHIRIAVWEAGSGVGLLKRSLDRMLLQKICGNLSDGSDDNFCYCLWRLR